MNKLSKDQIQKIFLSGLLMVGLIYCYFTFLITPLGKSETNAAARIEALNGELSKARSAVLRSRTVEEQARTAGETMAQASDMIPEGAPIAWFPPRMTAFFTRHNLKNVVNRNGGIGPAADPGLKDFRNGDWDARTPTGVRQPAWHRAGRAGERGKAHGKSPACKSPPRPTPRRKQHVSMNVLTLLK